MSHTLTYNASPILMSINLFFDWIFMPCAYVSRFFFSLQGVHVWRVFKICEVVILGTARSNIQMVLTPRWRLLPGHHFWSAPNPLLDASLCITGGWRRLGIFDCHTKFSGARSCQDGKEERHHVSKSTDPSRRISTSYIEPSYSTWCVVVPYVVETLGKRLD